jgi:hypothetical protein
LVELIKKGSNIGFNADQTALFQIEFGGYIQNFVLCISFGVAVWQVKPALCLLTFFPFFAILNG